MSDATLIERWAGKAPTDRRGFVIERKLFLSAYTLRKLSDDGKLSSATLSAPAVVQLARPLKPRFSGMLHWVDRYFDLEKPVRQSVSWRRILNMMIHSSTFDEVVDQNGRLLGFMVTSDREAGRGLVSVELSDFVNLLRTAGADYPSVVRHRWDAKAGRWVTWAGHDPASLA